MVSERISVTPYRLEAEIEKCKRCKGGQIDPDWLGKKWAIPPWCKRCAGSGNE